MGSARTQKVGISSLQKMNYVFESWGLRGKHLGFYLRSHGLYSFQLKLWKEQMSEGLMNNMIVSMDTKRDYLKKIADLEKKLREAEAIIEAQKKVQKILAVEDESMSLKAVKQSSKLLKKR